MFDCLPFRHVTRNNTITIGIIGVDPGMEGALALIVDGRLKAVFDMPVLELPGKKKLVFDKAGNPVEKVGKKHEIDPQGVRRVMANWRNHAGAPLILIMEKMWGRAGQDVVSTSKLLEGAGLVRGIAIGLGFDERRVAPSTWKSALGVSANKQTSLELARELIKGEVDEAKWYAAFKRKMDNGRAEAYLLGHYGFKLVNGE